MFNLTRKEKRESLHWTAFEVLIISLFVMNTLKWFLHLIVCFIHKCFCSDVKWKGRDKIITIKRTKDLNYFSLCSLNLFNSRVSQFELNYWNKWTFPWYSNLMRCTCKLAVTRKKVTSCNLHLTIYIISYDFELISHNSEFIIHNGNGKKKKIWIARSKLIHFDLLYSHLLHW